MGLGISQEALRDGLIFFLLLFASLILRAYAQAWVADKLGDPTPANDGRVTLYPVPHIDLLGTIVFPLLCIFYFQPRLGQINFFLAWTKPVPMNPSNFAHPRRDEVFAQLGGCAMSLLLLLLAAIAGGLLFRVEQKSIEIFVTLIQLNAFLVVLDLLPLPPLPGGMILRHWGIISEDTFWQIARWSWIVLLIAFNIAVVRGVLGLLAAYVATPFMAIYRAIAL
jgi:Zn-dependent protease